jgi:hypothetical protein
VGAEKAVVRSQTLHAPTALPHTAQSLVPRPQTPAAAVLGSGMQNQGIARRDVPLRRCAGAGRRC